MVLHHHEVYLLQNAHSLSWCMRVGLNLSSEVEESLGLTGSGVTPNMLVIYSLTSLWLIPQAPGSLRPRRGISCRSNAPRPDLLTVGVHLRGGAATRRY